MSYITPERILESAWSKIDEVIAEKNISKADLAARVGVTYPHLCSLIKYRRNAKYTTVYTIAAELGIQLNEL